MNDIPTRKIKTGGDPRTLSDYAVLRDELRKLTHPARPDVNWEYAEKLCLSLFEQNGVELQTASWYTLARTQLAGLLGLNEGLAIVAILIGNQWGMLWPQPVHARVEILSSLSQRLQKQLRTLSLSYSDLSQLYRAERRLIDIETVLQRLELKHLCQFETLRTMLHNSAVRLENSSASSTTVAFVQPRMQSPENREACEVKWVYVTQPEQQPNTDLYTAIPTPVKPWIIFTAGMCTMLVLGTLSLYCWQKIDPKPVNPLPVVANEDSLKVLAQFPPLWRHEYGFVLASSAIPVKAEKLKAQWQQSIRGNALPIESLSGWHQGMSGLSKLAQRLDALDERKGKYLTGSELKSMVFMITQDFGRAVPVEERLYRLSQTEGSEQLSSAQTLQLDIYFNQLLNRYALIKEQAGED
ncbi:hypothetical protein E1B03_10125 [Citrobacter arsenatis]|uniref:Type VI secretion system ImpA family N-terminal domain-containing protein n=1 Tax=Citrobacter arsenatis TaxID=2546350 RepID=A0A4P6WJA2_9ENTR|nr:VasL domain-containing protein [Citrobacter arsenatis]QBM22777.1 hypothetical protein E1B03_10125 [Citrobacter arsenatis]